ncbi:MAG: hypothetical protein KAS32_15745 [Candidatus Peribacteraceae bacterium]|nr:hypothetical protein [Candidatus Peribacteraceae bacterium]
MMIEDFQKRCESCGSVLKGDIFCGFFDECHNKNCRLAYKRQKGIRNSDRQ